MTAPRSATRPSSSTITRSARTDDIEQIVSDQHRGTACLGQHSRSSARIPAAAATSSPRSGSSRTRTSGSAASARASATRWPAPDSSPVRGRRAGGAHLLQPALGRVRHRPCGRPGAHATAGREQHIAQHAQMRKEQRVLEQEAHAAVVDRDEHPAFGVGQRTVPDSDQSGSPRSSPAITAAVVDFPAPFGPSTANTRPPRPRTPRQAARSATVAGPRDQPPAPPRNSTRSGAGEPRPTTTTTATAISRIDSATAASGSASRCR